VADDVARWSDEARQIVQVLGGWLEEAGRFQAEVAALESERAALADEVRRLREESDGLRAERDDLSVAVQTIASQTARTVDELLHRISGRREAPGDLAPR
jgi:uncharacterized coiled-coil DUF342 family protein